MWLLDVNLAQVMSKALQLEQAGESAAVSCRRAATGEGEAGYGGKACGGPTVGLNLMGLKPENDDWLERREPWGLRRRHRAESGAVGWLKE